MRPTVTAPLSAGNSPEGVKRSSLGGGQKVQRNDEQSPQSGSPQSGTIGPLYFDARVVKTCRRAEDGRVEVEVDLARVIRHRMTAGCDPLTDRVVGLEYAGIN